MSDTKMLVDPKLLTGEYKLWTNEDKIAELSPEFLERIDRLEYKADSLLILFRDMSAEIEQLQEKVKYLEGLKEK